MAVQPRTPSRMNAAWLFFEIDDSDVTKVKARQDAMIVWYLTFGMYGREKPPELSREEFLHQQQRTASQLWEHRLSILCRWSLARGVSSNNIPWLRLWHRQLQRSQKSEKISRPQARFPLLIYSVAVAKIIASKETTSNSSIIFRAKVAVQQSSMRLINTQTKKLEEFLDGNIPRYAILSHTWGENEVTFKDICTTGYISGSPKIDGCINQAIKEGVVDYVWIDTCCIDKSSSAELSEAINSMWKYYARSQDCYVYLSDVHPGDDIDAEGSQFRKSRWFKRGWTLQELIAPDSLNFYNSKWQCVGKTGYYRYHYERPFLQLISFITKIPQNMLWWARRDKDEALGTYSVAQKMSWAAGRSTTKVEDQAYCLFGLFGVNMSLLYGEGEAAFQRLQMKIIKSSDDESIFAWAKGDLCSPCRLLASVGIGGEIPFLFHTVSGSYCSTSTGTTFVKQLLTPSYPSRLKNFATTLSQILFLDSTILII